MKKVLPFIMFRNGVAEEAMNYYVSIIEDSKIINISRYDSNGPGEEGTVFQALFSLKGQEFMCIDSSVKHEFSFTPAFSIYVTCDSETEIDTIYNKLIENGMALMPLDDYGFSKKFGWLNDKFGLSWQLNLPL